MKHYLAALSMIAVSGAVYAQNSPTSKVLCGAPTMCEIVVCDPSGQCDISYPGFSNTSSTTGSSPGAGSSGGSSNSITTGGVGSASAGSSSGSSGGSTSSASASASGSASLSAGASSYSSSGAVGVKVNGNRFIDAATGKTVVLMGTSMSGLDGSAGYLGGAAQPQQWSYIAGITPPQWSAIAAKWGINTIRLPLNSAYWLNNTVYDDPAAMALGSSFLGSAHGYTTIGPNQYMPDPTGTYQAQVKATVANMTAAGIVVVIDLHCDAPKNSAGQYIACVGETSFPNADTSAAFWTGIANAFQSNPYVIFALFNEPYGSSNYNGAASPPRAVSGGGRTATPSSSAITMMAGGPYTPFSMLASDTTLVTINGGNAIQVASMPSLINAIRSTGAKNVIIAPPIWYSGAIQTWLASYTTASFGRTASGNPDPLAQFGMDWHNYGWSTGTSTPLAVLAAGYPILMTETFGFDGALDGGSDASGYAWAASNDIGVLLWAWATWDPNNGQGNPGSSSVYYNYMMNNAPWAAGHGAPAPTGGTFGQSVLTH
jgi:endoglucanase